jgi:hypothetical protein
MVVKKNLIFSPYKKSSFMPGIGSNFDSPGKTSTFSGSEDSLNRDREDDCSEGGEGFNYDIYEN